MAAAPAADLIGGATPFGWASLGIGALGALGGAAKAASAAPGMSSADALFGSSQVAPDFSNWQVILGGSEGTMTVGPKTGPVQSPTQNQDKVQSAASYPTSSGGGYAYPASGNMGQPMPLPAQGQAGGIPVMWLLIGAAVWLALKKS